MRLEEAVHQTVSRRPDRVAVSHRDRAWTYSELWEGVRSFRVRLAEAGFSEGDRALLWMENSAEYVIAYLSVLAAGGAVVALHPQVSASEVSRVISHVGATGVIVSPSIRQWNPGDFESTCLRFVLTENEIIRCRHRGDNEKNPDGLAQIIYTSGSTGRPKGVMLSHRNLIANTRSILEYLRLSMEDSIVAVLPFVYAYGNSVMLTHLFAGGKLIIENGFIYPNLILEKLSKEGATGFSGVASTYALLLNQSNLKTYSFSDLRYLTNAGGPMPSELLSRLRSAFPKKEIYLMYGQTEAAARLTCLPPEDLLQKGHTAGRPISGVALKIVKESEETARPGEVGEVRASGENIMQGYWKDPEATANALSAGWLRTGDIGYLDEEGYLTLVGRNSEMIKSGAFRISPAEIEEVLLRHPSVQEAGVVGVDDPILGEAICGVVAPKGEHQPTDMELLAYCARHLAPYKRPKVICVVKEIPKSFSGKVLRQELRAISRTVFKSPARTTHTGVRSMKKFSKDVLNINAEEAAGRIGEILRSLVFHQLKRKGVVVGLSGGIDSSVTAALCVKALGRERVLGLFMPELDSSDDSMKLGRLLADALGIETVVEDIAPLLEAAGCYRRRDDAIRAQVPEYGKGYKSKIVLANTLEKEGFNFFRLVVESDKGERKTVRLNAKSYLGIVAATNMKQRARKFYEYYHADRMEYAVAGTPNRLEYDQGFFVKNGDGAADFKPIAHLYKTQVYQLAAYLGVPAEIRQRPPTTDTYSLPQSQEEFYFSLPYDKMDLCLYGKNHQVPPEQVAPAVGLTPEQVERVYKDIDVKRSTTRYLQMKPLLIESIDEISH